jgi:hypothetical protein
MEVSYHNQGADAMSEYPDLNKSSEEKHEMVCRNCGLVLSSCTGGVFVPARKYGNKTRYPAPTNFYGGHVCSRRCDVEVCLRMESSMPGAGKARRVGDLAQKQIDSNWKWVSDWLGEEAP